uniref:MATH domain-containing protein n=1 Tax=Panagrolaimus sp. PS1159 TaxID=55785 RepID=A0AC35G6G0_9BILA
MEYSTSEIICPFNTEWKFQKIDFMELKDGFLKGKSFYAFNIPGLQYHIQIYPNGDEEDCLGEVWAFLQIICPDGRKVTCECTLFIESTNFSSTLNHIYQYDSGYGSMLCEADEFFDSKSKFFIDGEMNIKVKGTFKCERSSKSMILQPISMQWKITEKDLKAKMEDKDCITSKTIKIPKFSSEARSWIR